MSQNPYTLPTNLPVPHDDGAASHLLGAEIPDIGLQCTSGNTVSLREVCRRPTVLFFYPRTGVPGQPPNLGFGGEDWDDIPGARGCTPQNCGFRDLSDRFAALGVQIFGVSTQNSDFQLEFKKQNHVAFDYLSDAALELSLAMRLPTFDFPIESGGPQRLIRRMAWFVDDNRIKHCWYPVFPPDRNAFEVLEWLKRHDLAD